MELFNTTGFEVGDNVFVIIDGQKYHGKVVKVDSKMDRIAVDYSSDIECEVKDWFHKSFWSKQN